MKTRFFRTAAFLLALLMLGGVIAACGEGKPEDTTVAPVTTENTPAVTTDAVTEEGPEYVYNGNTYDGATFTVLIGGTAGNTFNDFKYNEENATVLDEAVYRKNSAVEEEYKVILEYVEALGSQSAAADKVQQQYTTGDNTFHAQFVSSYATVPLAYGGALYDLNSLPGFDSSNSWWDAGANEALTVKDVLFFTTGDISAWDDMQQFVIMFNKDLYKDAGITEDIYEIVRSGKWTYDMLSEYAKVITNDENGDDKMDMSDKYGILLWDDTIYGVFASTGAKIVSLDERGDLELTINNETAINALLKYTEISAGGDAINYQRYGSSGAPAIAMFSESRALFFLGRLQSFENFRDMQTAFGVLPYPKLSEAQDKYYSSVSYYHATFFCTTNADFDLEMRSDVIEALGYYSQLYLTPAYQERTLYGTYVRDDESVESLEIMAANRAYDFGFLSQPANINKELIYLFRKLSTDFASTFAAKKDAAESAIGTINEAYEAAVLEWSK